MDHGSATGERRLSDKDLEERLQTLLDLPPEVLARHLEPLVGPYSRRPGSIPDPQLTRKLRRVVRQVVKRPTQVIDTQVVRRMTLTLPIGPEIMRRRREIGMPRKALAKLANIHESKLDLVENEKRPPLSVLRGDELEQALVITDHRSVETSRVSRVTAVPQEIRFPAVRRTLLELRPTAKSESQQRALQRISSLLLHGSARMEATHLALRFYCKAYARNPSWFDTLDVNVDAVADLMLGISIHTCEFLRDDGTAAIWEASRREIKIPTVLRYERGFSRPLARRRALCRYAVARVIGENTLFGRASSGSREISVASLELPSSIVATEGEAAEAGAANAFAHELVMPRILLKREVTQNPLSSPQEILEHRWINGFLAEDRLRLHDATISWKRDWKKTLTAARHLPEKTLEQVSILERRLSETSNLIEATLARVTSNFYSLYITPTSPADHRLWHIRDFVNCYMRTVWQMTDGLAGRGVSRKEMESALRRLQREKGRLPKDTANLFNNAMESTRALREVAR